LGKASGVRYQASGNVPDAFTHLTFPLSGFLTTLKRRLAA
jgi:hypothetical protein